MSLLPQLSPHPPNVRSFNNFLRTPIGSKVSSSPIPAFHKMVVTFEFLFLSSDGGCISMIDWKAKDCSFRKRTALYQHKETRRSNHNSDGGPAALASQTSDLKSVEAMLPDGRREIKKISTHRDVSRRQEISTINAEE